MTTISLRPFNSRDKDTYHRLATSSKDIARFIPGVVGKDALHSASMVSHWMNINFETEFAFIIEVNEDDHSYPIGAIFASLERVVNSLNVSFFIASPYRHNGYMKETLKKFFSYIKHETPFRSLYFDIEPENVASQTLIRLLNGKLLGISPISIFSTFKRWEIIL